MTGILAVVIPESLLMAYEHFSAISSFALFFNLLTLSQEVLIYVFMGLMFELLFQCFILGSVMLSFFARCWLMGYLHGTLRKEFWRVFPFGPWYVLVCSIIDDLLYVFSELIQTFSFSQCLKSVGYNHHAYSWDILLRSYLTGLKAFFVTFSFIFSHAMSSSWSESQSAPGCIFVMCTMLAPSVLAEDVKFLVPDGVHRVMSKSTGASCVTQSMCSWWWIYVQCKTLPINSQLHSSHLAQNFCTLPLLPGVLSWHWKLPMTVTASFLGVCSNNSSRQL